MQKTIFYYWKNSKIPKVPSSAWYQHTKCGPYTSLEAIVMLQPMTECKSSGASFSTENYNTSIIMISNLEEVFLGELLEAGIALEIPTLLGSGQSC